jgi:hypothetical protein
MPAEHLGAARGPAFFNRTIVEFDFDGATERNRLIPIFDRLQLACESWRSFHGFTFDSYGSNPFWSLLKTAVSRLMIAL